MLYLISTSSILCNYCTLPRTILTNIFLVFHISLVFHSPKNLRNRLENMWNLENNSHTALRTVTTTHCWKFYLSLLQQYIKLKKKKKKPAKFYGLSNILQKQSIFLKVFVLVLNSRTDWFCFLGSCNLFHTWYALKRIEFVLWHVVLADVRFKVSLLHKL